MQQLNFFTTYKENIIQLNRIMLQTNRTSKQTQRAQFEKKYITRGMYVMVRQYDPCNCISVLLG